LEKEGKYHTGKKPLYDKKNAFEITLLILYLNINGIINFFFYLFF